MDTLLRSIWAGELPLADAFWRYAVGYGLLVNLVTSGLFLVLLMHEVHAVLLVLAYILPLPYNAFIVVGVWRSADHYGGARHWADLARAVTVIWMIALSAT